MSKEYKIYNEDNELDDLTIKIENEQILDINFN